MSEVNTTNDGGPAFPVTGDTMWQGISVRDYFAAKALQGMGASDEWSASFDTADPDYLETVAKTAYAAADAMLKAREQ